MNRHHFALKPLKLLGLFGAASAVALAPATVTSAEPQSEAAISKSENADAIAAPEASTPTAYDFDFTRIDGTPMPLASFKGKTLLVVNTASLCGYTDQYGDLQEVFETFADRGLVVIGAPSNDFGGQEPGKEDDIKEFCEVNFNVRFPLTEKVIVKGDDAHPFYQWAKNTLGEKNAPSWNFHKYLVGSDGQLIAAFPSRVKPTSPQVKEAIEKSL